MNLQSNDLIIAEQPINYLEVYYYLERSGLSDRLYSCLYLGENHIPGYVGVDLVKPQAEILAVPAGRAPLAGQLWSPALKIFTP